MLEVNNLFKDLAKQLSDAPKNGNTKEIMNAVIKLNNIEENVLTLKCRHSAMLYAIGEMIWYLSARNDVNFISHFSKFWEKITDDGTTSNSAYGYIIHKKFDFDQLECIIDELKRNPESRRAVININTPSRYRMVTRDTQCTMFLQYYIRDNKLHCTANMRSNDLIKGLTFDIVYFTELQKYVARRLGLEYGTYTHFDVSLHTYDSDFKTLENIVNETEEVKVKYNLDRLWDKTILNKLVDKVDNNWISKEDFENYCVSLGIIDYLC